MAGLARAGLVQNAREFVRTFGMTDRTCLLERLYVQQLPLHSRKVADCGFRKQVPIRFASLESLEETLFRLGRGIQGLSVHPIERLFLHFGVRGRRRHPFELRSKGAAAIFCLPVQQFCNRAIVTDGPPLWTLTFLFVTSPRTKWILVRGFVT